MNQMDEIELVINLLDVPPTLLAVAKTASRSPMPLLASADEVIE